MDAGQTVAERLQAELMVPNPPDWVGLFVGAATVIDAAQPTQPVAMVHRLEGARAADVVRAAEALAARYQWGTVHWLRQRGRWFGVAPEGWS